MAGRVHRYTREIPESAPFSSGHGAHIGSIGVFPVIKITVVRQVRMSPVSSAVWAWRKTHVEDRGRICFAFVFVCVCGRQKPEYPQFEPHGWQHHYTERCMRSGIFLVCLWKSTSGQNTFIFHFWSFLRQNTKQNKQNKTKQKTHFFYPIVPNNRLAASLLIFVNKNWMKHKCRGLGVGLYICGYT